MKAMSDLYGTDITADELRSEVELTREALTQEFLDDALETYEEKEKEYGGELMRELERFIILQVVDHRWREHLENMDYLREGVHLRAMAQKDPLVEYTAEGHVMFEELNAAIREEVVQLLFHAELQPDDVGELQELQEAQSANGERLSYEHESLAGSQAIAAAGLTAAAGDGVSVMAGALGGGGGSVATMQRTVSEHEKVGRNDPCWCGSGKKFKKCHGA